MNKLVLLACLAVVGHVAARPDVSLGYRYQQSQSQSGGSNFLTAPELLNSGSASGSYQPTASGTTYYNSVPSIGQVSSHNVVSSSVGSAGFVPSTQVFGGGAGFQSNVASGGSFQSNVASGVAVDSSVASIGLSGIVNGPSVNYPEQEAYLSHLQNYQPALVSKHFYIHSAPEDHDEQQIVRYVNVGRPQKNYRVVFINAPSSTANKAKIIANVAPVEDKTAIYVLSKKSNALDVTAEVVTPAPTNNKPEVFFIKYKTPQEAQHAQQTIQAQYDALGGSSQVTNEGLVPVSSVIGSLGDNGASGVLTDNNGGVSVVGTGGVPVTGGSSNGGGSVQFIGGSTGGSNYDAEGSSSVGVGVGQLGFNVVQTGNNLQSTYLPAAHH